MAITPEQARAELERRKKASNITPEQARQELERRKAVSAPLNPGLRSPDSAPAFTKLVEAGLTAAGGEAVRAGSNIKELFGQITGNQGLVDVERAKQAQAERINEPLERDFPVSTFAGRLLPGFAVPGGKFAQIGAGVAEGALEGTTPLQRLTLGGLGGTLGLIGVKAGDFLGARAQNKVQQALGDPDAAARRELLDADVPLSLSQRASRDSVAGGKLSRPIARFFERAKFALTGNQPLSNQQQQRLVEIMGDALDVKGRRLTREVLGEAVNKNSTVFSNAAERVAAKTDDGLIRPDQEFFNALDSAKEAFAEVGSDSPQIERIFQSALEEAGTGQFNPKKYLKIRSNLSAATAKPAADAEIPAIVSAIDAFDDLLARQAPDVASDLKVARDRFRLLLAVRRGAALSPSGEVNIPTLTKNLERIFNNFDAGAPLPGVTRQAGEVVAGLNQILDGFRSSGTAENLLSTDPVRASKALAPLVITALGGGTGALLGGGTARSLLDLARLEDDNP